MGWITYVDGVQRRGKILYHLQGIDDRFAGPHPVLPGGDRRIDVYATEADARRAARPLPKNRLKRRPTVEDMDAIYAWASDARVETSDYARCGCLNSAL